MDKPYLIEGGLFADQRGSISHVNDFRVEHFTRFYTIEHSDCSVIRAWQGHRFEVKAFYVVNGVFAINAVDPGSFDNPDPNAEVLSFSLSAAESKVLIVPQGYANGFKALVPGSKMVVFSNHLLENSHTDIIRFPVDFWRFKC